MLKLESIKRIRSFNLSISDEPFFPKNHVAWPSGYIICKPADIGGNGHTSVESWFENSEGVDVQTDVPSIRIWNQFGKTHLEISEFAPGPGPGEFKDSFDNENDAIERVARYYFDSNDQQFKEWYEYCEQDCKYWDIE